MGCIRGDVGEERFVSLLLCSHPNDGLVEKNISAVTFSFFECPVVKNRRIEIFIVGGIATTSRIGLTNPTCTMDEHLIKASFVGPVGGLIAQMPFAKYPGGVVCGFQNLGKGDGFGVKPFPFENSVGDTIFEFMPARHKCRASRGTGGAHMKIGETNTLRMKLIEVWCFKNRIAMGCDIAIALIIGHYDDDVAWGFRKKCSAKGQSDKRKHKNLHDECQGDIVMLFRKECTY